MTVDADESRLVKAAQEGDSAALGRLLLSHYRTLAGFVAPKIPPHLTRIISVDDVLQQAFADAFQNVAKYEYRGEGSFLAWIKTVTEYRLQTVVREQMARKRGGQTRQIQQIVTPQGSMAQLVELLSAEDPTASQLLARREGVDALRVAVASLPEQYAEVIVLRYFEGRSIDETAQQMGRTPAATRSLTDRAKIQLRRALGSISLYFSTG